jgi:hypothetical protein
VDVSVAVAGDHLVAEAQSPSVAQRHAVVRVDGFLRDQYLLGDVVEQAAFPVAGRVRP